MGEKPKKPKPTAGERALAKDSAIAWNDYVERYIPVENEFIERNKATDDKVAAAQNAVNADSAMAYGDASKSASSGLAAQGAAPGSGRSALGRVALQDAHGAASGLGQAVAQQGVHDTEQATRVKMSAFGRDMQDNTSLALGNSARTANRAMLSQYQNKLNDRAALKGTLLSAGGMAAGAAFGGDGGGGNLAQPFNKGLSNFWSGRNG